MNKIIYFIKKIYYKNTEKLLSDELLLKEEYLNKKYKSEQCSEGKIKIYTHQTGYSKNFTRFYTSSRVKDSNFYLVERPEDADAIVFINTIDNNIIKPGKRIILFFHEPLDYAHMYQSTIDWRKIEYNSVCVVSHLSNPSLFITNPERIQYLRSIPYVHFHHMAQYSDFSVINTINRRKQVCAITSGFAGIPGYEKRRNFIEMLSAENSSLDLYGRFNKIVYNINCYRGPCATKWKKLAEYKYNLVIENSNEEYYISEKIFDSLISGCMPIYHGSEKIFEIIPKEWFYYLPTLNATEIPALNAFLKSDAHLLISKNREEITDYIYERYSFYSALERILENQPLSVSPSNNKKS